MVLYLCPFEQGGKVRGKKGPAGEEVAYLLDSRPRERAKIDPGQAASRSPQKTSFHPVVKAEWLGLLNQPKVGRRDGALIISKSLLENRGGRVALKSQYSFLVSPWHLLPLLHYQTRLSCPDMQGLKSDLFSWRL